MTTQTEPLLTTPQVPTETPAAPTVDYTDPALVSLLTPEFQPPPADPVKATTDEIKALKEELAAARKTFEEKIASLSKTPEAPPEPTLADLNDADFQDRVMDTFVTNAPEAIKMISDRSSQLKQREERLYAQRATQANEQVLALVPDAKVLLDDKAAQGNLDTFLASEPTLKSIYEEAGKTFNAQARALVLREFFRTQQPTNPAPKEEPIAVDPKAALATLSNNAPTKAPASAPNQSKGPMLSKQAIQNLIQTDRARYNTLLPVIEAAYREGRVV